MAEEGSKLPTMAELQSKPTEALKDFLALASEHSRLSESTVRKDFECSDGVLAVTSHNGGQVAYTEQPPAAPPVALPGEG